MGFAREELYRVYPQILCKTLLKDGIFTVEKNLVFLFRKFPAHLDTAGIYP